MVGKNKGVKGKQRDIQDPRGGISLGLGPLDSHWKMGGKFTKTRAMLGVNGVNVRTPPFVF